MANYLKGIGDAATRVNEILPSFDARINGFIVGHTAGIIKDEYNEFKAEPIDRGVIIRSGLMQAHGYFACADADTQINFVMPSGVRYVQIYAEIDLSVSPNRFAVKATPLSNSTAWTARQDNLRSTTNGKYQLHLWQVTLTASMTTFTDKRAYISKPMNAVNAETASNALALAGAGITRAGGVFTVKEGSAVIGKLVSVPANAKLEYKIPLLSETRYFAKGYMEIEIPNYSNQKTYEWVYSLIGNNPGGEAKRVRGGEFILPMSASGNAMFLFVYGGPTFYDGIACSIRGETTDFGGEQLRIHQIYEIAEVG